MNPDNGQFFTPDSFALEAKNLSREVIKRVRVTLGVSGVISAIFGLLILVWPGETLEVATVILGVYFTISAIFHIIGAFTSRFAPGGWRVLEVLLGILFIIAGVIMLKNIPMATETLILVFAIILGVTWIAQGIFTLMSSGLAPSQGWAIFFGVLSIIAGIIVLFAPGWSAAVLIIFAGISLVVIGVIQIFYAFSFGRQELRQLDQHDQVSQR